MNSIWKVSSFLLIILSTMTLGCITSDERLSNQQNIPAPAIPTYLTPVPGIAPFSIDAENIIRNYTESPGINLTFKGIRNYSYADLYGFESGNYSYWVNNVTRRVQSMSFYDTRFVVKNETINIDSGLIIAESYARLKFPEFWENGTSIVVKKISQTSKDNEFKYSWRQFFVFPEISSTDLQEIAGFNQIDITLDARDGKVISYHEWFIPNAKINLHPGLSEEQAWESVKKYYEDSGLGSITINQSTSLGLVIAVDRNNIQHLAWQFEIKEDKLRPHFYGGQIIIDAHNGQVVRFIELG